MIGISQGLNIEAQDWREDNNIATDHGPMVHRGLLTTHPGGDHGGGEASRGQTSLQQGAGTGRSGDPEIGIAAAAEQWVFSWNGGTLCRFLGR